jgi:hypothetical protein
LLYASCGIHEEHSYELLGNSEIVFTLPSFCFPSSPFHPPLFVLLFLNPTFHGQSLIGLLGAGVWRSNTAVAVVYCPLPSSNLLLRAPE